MLFQSKSRFLVLGILWAIGITFLVFDYGSQFRGNLSYVQFWLGILFCMIPAFFLLLDNAFSWRGKVFVLFMWGTTLYVPKVLRSPNFLNFQDEILHFQTLKLIYESGTLGINPTIFKISMYYPGLELLAVSLKSVTTLSLFSTAILLIGLIHSLLPVFIFLILKKIASSDRIAALGAFIFTSNPRYFFFHSSFGYESLGIFFVALLVFLITKKAYEANNALFFSCLSLVVLPALAITHHFSSDMFLLFLIILILLQFYKNVISEKSTMEKLHIHFVLLAATFIFAWQTYCATISINYFQGLLTYRIDRILNFLIFGEQRALFLHSPLPNYEIFIDTYLYIPLILLLSGLGVYFIRKERKLRNTFVHSCILYGPLLTFLSLPLILTYSADIAYRSWSFLFMGVSFVVAHAVNKMIQQKNFLTKTFAFSAVVLIIIAGISLGDNESGRFLGSSKLVSGPVAITSDVVCASSWFEGKEGRYNNLLGDLTIHWVFGGYGVQNATTFEAWNVFFPKTISNSVISALEMQSIGYVIADRRITESLGQFGFYFSRTELDIEDHPGYGSAQPLPKECLDKFDDGVFLSRMYSNGNITIYKINLEKFP